MRLHIEMDDDLVAQIDVLAGQRGRSAFVRDAVRGAVDRERRYALLQSVAGALTEPHEWDSDPADWVRKQRRADPRRVG